MPGYSFGLAKGGTHQTLLAMVPPGCRVLDVGCASGYLGRELAARGCRVWGVEADPGAAATARAVGYQDVLGADLDVVEALPWSESFDVVLAADVLEHIKGASRLLSLIRRQWLAPGGDLLVSLPNVANVAPRLSLLAGRFDYTETGILDATHLRLFTYRSARQLLASEGFAVIDERAGSDRFGALLNGGLPGHRALRGLLAYDIIMRARSVEHAPLGREGT